MKHSKIHRFQSSALASSIIAVLATSFFTVAAHTQDWDGDSIADSQDWGVALTFDMHPGGEPYWYWTEWQTQKDVVDILNEYGAKATFFVGHFANAGPGTPWNWLLNDAELSDHELAWHGRQHLNAQTWMNNGGQAVWYVNSEVRCEVPNYVQANPGWWPSSLESYAYPFVAGHDLVDEELKKYVGHARGGGGPAGPLGFFSYPTNTIASTFRLQGSWLDKTSLCAYSSCNLNENKKLVNRAYTHKHVAILAAHSFVDGNGSGYSTEPAKLREILEHVNCLRNGGTVAPDGVGCTPGSGGGSNTVYHRFRDLPIDPSRPALQSVPASSYCG